MARKEIRGIKNNLEEKSRLSDAARQKRNEYRREWYRKNKEKQREYMERYWERKAAGCEGDVR